MVVQLKQCCCGCSLKTGTIIIAALGIFGGFGMIVSAFFKPDRTTKIDGMDSIHGLDNLTAPNGEQDQTLAVVMKVVMASVEIIMSAVLLAGAIKGRPKLVYSWIVLNVVQNALTVIVVLTLGIYLAVTGLLELGLALVFALVIVEVAQVYWILVVNSFHTTILSPPTYEYTMTKEPIMQA